MAQAYITCLIKPFLIKGKQFGSVGSAFSCETKSSFMQIKWMLWKTVLINPQIEISTFCDQPDVTSCSSHFRWKTVLNNPQIDISTFCDQPDVTLCSSLFHQNKNKNFSIISKNLSIGITWILSEWVLLWIDVKMISVRGIALKFQKFCMKTTPCK